MNELAAIFDSADAVLPGSYKHAVAALAQCAQVDECKAWLDKARALAAYAKQAHDTTLHEYAMRIQARATRRAGELLKEFDGRGGDRTGKKGDVPLSATRREAAKDGGLSPDQQKQAVRVASIPAPLFDDLIEAPKPPTVSALAEMGIKPRSLDNPPPGFALATNFMGLAERLAKLCGEHQPAEIMGGLLPHEIEPARAQMREIEKWTAAFAALEESKS